MLEMAASGIPFFAFLRDNLGEVRPQYLHNYEQLKEAGLLSVDPTESARLIRRWIKEPRPKAFYRRQIKTFARGIVRQKSWKLLSLIILIVKLTFSHAKSEP
jgi:hypothetical protein